MILKCSRNQTLLLLFIVVGFVIRLYHLDFQTTNWDEDFTILHTGGSIIDVVRFSLTNDYTPPIYYCLANISITIFGATSWAIRLPSLVFGTALIPVMWLIGKEYKDELFGLMMAGAGTIFYNLYFYAKYGRSYSVALFWFSVAFYFFLRVLKGDKKAGLWFGIMAVLSIWTHLYSAIPLGIMVLYLMWTKGLNFNIVPIMVGLIPLAYFYVPLILNTRIAGTNENVFGATPWEILFLTPVDIFGYSALVMFPIVVWTLWIYRKETVVGFIGLVSILVWSSLFALSIRTPIILHYAIFLVPMLLMVFMIPVWDQIRNGWKMRYIFAVIMILVLECYQIFLLNFVQRSADFF